MDENVKSQIVDAVKDAIGNLTESIASAITGIVEKGENGNTIDPGENGNENTGGTGDTGNKKMTDDEIGHSAVEEYLKANNNGGFTGKEI